MGILLAMSYFPFRSRNAFKLDLQQIYSSQLNQSEVKENKRKIHHGDCGSINMLKSCRLAICYNLKTLLYFENI